jgi:hypothetical protein
VISEIGQPRRRLASREIRRRCDKKPSRAPQFPGYETRIRLLSDPEREVGALGDEVLVPVRDHQIDPELRMVGEEIRKERNDPPHAKGRRQRHAQKTGKPVRAARRVLGVVDRCNRLARPDEQGFARVGRGNLARRPREQLDAQSGLERGDRARDGRLRQPELLAGLRKAPGFNRAGEERKLMKPIIHTACAYII